MNKLCILVPLDGSKTAEAALPYAETLARCIGSDLLLLHVVAVENHIELGTPPAWAASYHEEALRRSETYLTQTAAEIRMRGLSAETLLRVGEVSQAILQVATDRSAAQIVLTSHGHGGVKRWLLGTAAEAVLCGSTLPVLLIQSRSPRLATYGPIRQIQVPLDGSPEAESALPLARDLAARTGALLLLTSVVDSIASGVTRPVGKLNPPSYEEQEAAVLGYLERLVDHVGLSGGIEAVVLHGKAAAALIDSAHSRRVDLIMMSSRGYRSSPRTVLGSVVDAVIRSGIPTMLVHPSTATAEAANQIQVQKAGFRGVH